MNSTGQAEVIPEVAERQIRDLLASTHPPSSIASIRFELGTDHVGDAAVRIFLIMDPVFAANFDNETSRREELGKFSSSLASNVLRLESGYFPYIRLIEAQ
jgi:hypothetical protein